MLKLSLTFLIFFAQLAFANPPYPPPPQYPPSGPDYGPGYTSFWQDAGTFKVQKVIKDDVKINTNHQYVNEIVLRVSNAPVDIDSAYVQLSSGHTIELRHIYGTISQNREMRFRLDYYNSLRASRIVLRAKSPQVVGPSSKVQVILGIAR